MIRSLFTAGSGILSGQRQIDTISNNIANINTIGFKESRVNFSDVFYANLQGEKINPSVDRLTNPGIQIGHGVMPISISKNLNQGTIMHTGNLLDFAIKGEGFFGVNRNGELNLTRLGSFNLDSTGRLVNPDGYPVLGEFNENLLDFSNINVSSEGIIYGTDREGIDQQIGVIHTFNVEKPKGLLSLGDSLYAATENSGLPNRVQADVRQGYLEGSNVDIAEQLTRLILSQRALQSSAKLIQSTDEMMAQANNLRR